MFSFSMSDVMVAQHNSVILAQAMPDTMESGDCQTMDLDLVPKMDPLHPPGEFHLQTHLRHPQ